MMTREEAERIAKEIDVADIDGGCLYCTMEACDALNAAELGWKWTVPTEEKWYSGEPGERGIAVELLDGQATRS